jgi:hypothetical protein
MYTLLELSVFVSLCCNKKLKNLKTFLLGQFRYVAIPQFRYIGCSTAARCLWWVYLPDSAKSEVIAQKVVVVWLRKKLRGCVSTQKLRNVLSHYVAQNVAWSRKQLRNCAKSCLIAQIFEWLRKKLRNGAKSCVITQIFEWLRKKLRTFFWI